jgi:predicted esterase
MAQYDIPKALEVIRENIVPERKINLFGYSQGASVLLASLSEDILKDR